MILETFLPFLCQPDLQNLHLKSMDRQGRCGFKDALGLPQAFLHAHLNPKCFTRKRIAVVSQGTCGDFLIGPKLERFANYPIQGPLENSQHELLSLLQSV
jgi:hypothetical protein